MWDACSGSEQLYSSAIRAEGSALPPSDRRPVNFMLYLETLHILCLLCRTSFLPLIRWNGKYLTAAPTSIISLRNRFENGGPGGPAVTTCRSDFILDLCLTPTLLQRGSEISASVAGHELHMTVRIKRLYQLISHPAFQSLTWLWLRYLLCTFKMTFTAEAFIYYLKYVQAKFINLDTPKGDRR